MAKAKSPAKKISAKHLLYFQILFTALAFTVMVFLSEIFMRNIVHRNLIRNAESVFTFAQTQLESNLQQPKMILSGFSQTIRNMIIRGDNEESIQNYVNDITSYFNSDDSHASISIVLFGYIEAFGEPFFICSGEKPPDWFIPSERPWYARAIDKCGAITETTPYYSPLSESIVISYSRCIIDDNGRRIGIAGISVDISDIGRNIVEIAMDQDGYGILLSQDLTIIAHTNPNFLGVSVKDPSIPISIFVEDFISGRDVVERQMTNWKGENSIAFFRRIENGWYLGLLTPEGPFYQSLTNMAAILVTLGCLLATALICILIRIDMARSKSDRENRYKSAFLANMSHEIRTPMNAIIGMATIGKSAPDIERKDICFNKIREASGHLLGVINDILDMSKIEANKFELSFSEFNFEKLLLRVVDVVNISVDQKKQRFNVHIDQHIPQTLVGDDQRIAQVITNLLGNAIKFTPESGSVFLDARFLEEKDEICNIQIKVSDTGIGIAPEQHKRLFSSFEQAESSTTRKYGGTGLGLPISKRIVELMGGSIWIDSELNKGSTFTFVLPLKRGVQSPRKLLSPDVNLTNLRIMAVDDDRDVLDYFTEITQSLKIHCDTAGSGEEAIRLVEQNDHYNIFFVDWKMPGMSGIQLASELKAHHASTKSVVIMISAIEWSSIEKDAREAGVEKFLSKPLFPSHIADIINEVLDIDYKHLEEAQTDIKGLFRGHRILLAEDVEINREIIKALLEPTNIEIDFAENGIEALRKFNKAPDSYELIFMDVQMPEMDGYETTRRIRALNIPQAKTIRIVAMTANVFREDIEKCLEVGMNSHIGKPLDFYEVLETLNTFLRKREIDSNKSISH